MPKIEIVNSSPDSESIRLYNGDLLIVNYRNLKPVTQDVYMVSTYGDEFVDANWQYAKRSSQYCAFVNLSNGLRAFKEPCSRVTTRQRITEHFSPLQIEHMTIIRSKSYKICIEPDVSRD